MGIIYYHMKEPEVTVLGPGTRYVLWVQGCNKNCPGCIAPESHSMTDGKQITIDALVWEIALSDADGLTVSGGEPFLQAEVLAELIKSVRRIRPIDVIVFTGYYYEELLQKPEAQKLLSQIDLLIDGPYIRELDDGIGLRGSSNQRIIPLTDRFKNDMEKFHTLARKQELFQHGSEIHAVGIPRY